MRTFSKYVQTPVTVDRFTVPLFYCWIALWSYGIAMRLPNDTSVQSTPAHHAENNSPANTWDFARLENHNSRNLAVFDDKSTRGTKLHRDLKFPVQTRQFRRDGQIQRRPRSGLHQSVFLERQKSRNFKTKHRKKLSEVLSVLTSEEKLEPDEACHTQWIKNDLKNSEFQPLKSYGTLYDSPLPGENRNRRHVHDINDDARSSAIYFPGHATLRWSASGESPTANQLSFTSALFTVEVWIRPEGGQQNPAVILEAQEDILDHSEQESSVWTLGIKTLEENGDRNAALYYSTTNGDGKTSTIVSNAIYKPEKWAHVAVSSSGGMIRLFVNAVQVAVSREHGSRIHPPPPRNCSLLILGGNGRGGSSYRGVVDKLMLWKIQRPPSDIRNDMYNFDATHHPSTLLLKESFENYRNRWTSGDIPPEKVFEIIPSEHSRLHFPQFRAPPCGQTICDNPDIIRSYVDNWTLRKSKTLRYNVVSINENDGSKPMATPDEVSRQNLLLFDVFEKHNITWIPNLININNSALKHKTIGCEPTKIGNRECNRECMHARLGHDGGDCDVDESLCDSRKKGDGHCDSECNKMYHGWDLGDCCDPTHTDTDQTCFDPGSTHRAYLSITEYKKLVGADNRNQLSVLFANWTNPNSIGISTFPWDKHAFLVQGGTVVQLKTYTTAEEMSGLIHELGHNLGLLHVHHGAHAISCDDACTELKPSMTTGDFCEDTYPTPMNTRCEEPSEKEAFCSIFNFTKTPYDNFMSYADGSCQNKFTPQQRARMHCYIDMVYRSWSERTGPGPIPLPPKVVRSSSAQRSVTLAWPPPIDGKVVGGHGTCDTRCNADGSLKQFATNASSPAASKHSSWSPDQATGPPDQEPCTLRGVHFWMPSGSNGEDVDCGTSCYIDLEFSDAVVPALIRVWVTYGAEDGLGVKKIEMRHDDNTMTTISSIQGYCDMPLSVRIKTKKKTNHVRVYVYQPYTAIDSVEIISEENNPMCAGCRNIKYQIHRSPPFKDRVRHTTEQLVYTDTTCEEGITYTYAVQPFLRSLQGEISPPVHYRLGQTFCGDGKFQMQNNDEQTEECDDGNMDAGDGCDGTCRIETGFNCKGQPSLCYWYEGDDECEEFERPFSPDCMLPPPGYTDVWAVDASSSSEAVEALVSSDARIHCARNENTLGPPDSVCTMPGSYEKGPPQTGAWSPCVIPGLTKSADDHWIKMVYEEVVQPIFLLIYFATNRSTQPTVEDFTLILPDGEVIPARDVDISCAAAPAVIALPENKDRTPIKDVVIKFSSSNIAIDAVAIRTKLDAEPADDHSPISQPCTAADAFSKANVTCFYHDLPVSSDAEWRNETVCFVKCSLGYLPLAAQKIVCVDRMWEGEARCAPVSCEPPSHVKFASFDCPNGHGWNAVCNFSCLGHARKVGGQSTFRCEENGTWSTPSAFCEPGCSVPPKIGFAFSSCSALSRRVSRPGDTCKYRCKTGYHVTQPPLVKRTFRLTCEDDGLWKGPGCQPVVCPDLKRKFKGTFKCTRGVMFGSICTVSCRSDLSVISDVVRCESNGQWNSSFSACLPPDEACLPPVAPLGIEITCSGHDTGQTCKAKCITKGRRSLDIVAQTEIGAGESLLEELDRKTRVLVCTGNSWLPKPDLLSCFDECAQPAIGNKHCNSENNRAYCNWDGGDCCQSTNSGEKMVAHDCGGGCRCKDPNAIENTPMPLNHEEQTEGGKSQEIQKVILLPLNAPKSAKMMVVSSKSTLVESADLQNKNALNHDEDEDIVPKENFNNPRIRKRPKGRSSGRNRGKTKGRKKSGGKSSSTKSHKKKRKRKSRGNKREFKRRNKNRSRKGRSKRRKSPV